MIFISLLISSLSFAGEYDQAIRTTVSAVAKQTGLEADFKKIRSASNKATVKWARDNGLETPLTIISFVTPVVYRKQIRFNTGDITFKGERSKVSMDWNIQF